MSILQRITSTWRGLIEPSASITDPERRLKSRFLIRTLAILFPIGFFFTFLPLLILPQANWLRDTDILFVLPTLALLAFAYGWAHRGEYEKSVWWLSLVGSIAIFIIAVQDGDVEDLVYFLLVLFLASMFLPPRWLWGVFIGQAILVFWAPFVSPVPVNVVEFVTSEVAFLVVGFALILLLNTYREQLETLHQRLLRQRERQYRELFEILFEGMVIVRDGVIEHVTESFATFVGRRRETLIGRPLLTLFPPESHAIIKHILAEKKSTHAHEVVAWNAENQYVYLEVVGKVFYFDETPVHILAFRDITHRKHMEQELHYRAHHDVLTGLPNRAALLARLQQMIDEHQNAKNNSGAFALLFLDLDRFKLINDSLGHTVGDQVLREVAIRLQSARREDDIVARLGGDEFVLVLTDVHSPHEAEQVAKRLLDVLRQPIRVNDHELYVDASIGIAMDIDDYTSAMTLLQDADIAMYHAKAEGRGTYRFFKTAMREQIQRTHAMKMELRRAIEHQQFVPFYQPIFNLQQNRVVGMEVFMRWQHPERGLISPETFLPLLEEMGALYAVNLSVYEQAFRDFSQWKRTVLHETATWLHVNVDTLQLMQSGFVQDLLTRIEAHGLSPSDIAVQVHEPVLLSRSVMVEKTLQMLQSAGVHLVIDDFGTGYSSLTLLHHVKPAAVMLDRSLIEWLDSVEYVRVLKGLVNLMHTMQVTIGIEGIETEAQLDRLHQLTFEWGQGYALGRPMSSAAAMHWWHSPPVGAE